VPRFSIERDASQYRNLPLKGGGEEYRYYRVRRLKKGVRVGEVAGLYVRMYGLKNGGRGRGNDGSIKGV